MLLSYQLKIDDLYNIPIGNFKKFVANFDKKKVHKKSMCFIMRTCNFYQGWHHVLEFIQSWILKSYVEFNT